MSTTNQHHIKVTPTGRRARVSVDGTTIVETERALSLVEGQRPATQYLPREDANMALLVRTNHSTHCPFKGDASYFTIKTEGRTLENAVWTYENPLAGAEAIRDHLAFYTDRVKLELDPAG